MMRTLGQYMMGSAATFGYAYHPLTRAPLRVHSFFMAIGTTIRTESSPVVTEAFSRINRPPIVLPRKYQSLRTSSDGKN